MEWANVYENMWTGCVIAWYNSVLTAEHRPLPSLCLLLWIVNSWACFWAVLLACVCRYKWFPNTFISSRLAGRTPGLRFDRELFSRAGAGGRGGGGGAVGKDTTMEVGRLPALLLWPSATGLQRENVIKRTTKVEVIVIWGNGIVYSISLLHG